MRALLPLILLAACRSPTPPTPPADAGRTAPTVRVELDAERARLVGRWRVVEAPGRAVEWRVGPDTFARVVDGTPRRGWLRVIEPGRLLIKGAGVGTLHLGYAHDGDRVWIGPGRGGFTVGDTLVLAENGQITVRGGVCWWAARRLGGGTTARFAAPQAIECTLDAAALRYALPRRSRPGEVDARSVPRIGGALVGAGLAPAVRLP